MYFIESNSFTAQKQWDKVNIYQEIKSIAFLQFSKSWPHLLLDKWTLTSPRDIPRHEFCPTFQSAEHLNKKSN